MIPIIQNLITTCVSGHPFNSKWWCNGAILNILFPIPVLYFEYLKYITWIITERASITNTPPIIISKISYFNKIANVPSAAPDDRDPTSPINIFAGYALNHRKPIHAPIKARENMNSSPLEGA